jgi:hypothetical protein
VSPEEVGDRTSGGRIVAAIQPQLRAAGEKVLERPIRKPLKPCRPFSPAHRRPDCGVANGNGVLVAEHGHGEACIQPLVCAV